LEGATLFDAAGLKVESLYTATRDEKTMIPDHLLAVFTNWDSVRDSDVRRLITHADGLCDSRLKRRLEELRALEEMFGEPDGVHCFAVAILNAFVRFVEKHSENCEAELPPDALEALVTIGRRPRWYGHGETKRLDFRDANLPGKVFTGHFEGADFSDAWLTGASFRAAMLSGALFDHASLQDADFSGVDMRGASLKGAFCGGTNFRGANLSDADLSSAHDLTSEQFEECILRNARLPRLMPSSVEPEPVS
jgi:hypothetical protein